MTIKLSNSLLYFRVKTFRIYNSLGEKSEELLGLTTMDIHKQNVEDRRPTINSRETNILKALELKVLVI